MEICIFWRAVFISQILLALFIIVFYMTELSVGTTVELGNTFNIHLYYWKLNYRLFYYGIFIMVNYIVHLLVCILYCIGLSYTYFKLVIPLSTENLWILMRKQNKSYFLLCKFFAKCPIHSYEFHEIYLYLLYTYFRGLFFSSTYKTKLAYWC